MHAVAGFCSESLASEAGAPYAVSKQVGILVLASVEYAAGGAPDAPCKHTACKCIEGTNGGGVKLMLLCSISLKLTGILQACATVLTAKVL